MYTFINNTPFNMLTLKVNGPLHVRKTSVESAVKIHYGDKEFYEEEIKESNISCVSVMLFDSIIRSGFFKYERLEDTIEVWNDSSVFYVRVINENSKDKNDITTSVPYRIESFPADEMFYYTFDDDVNVTVSDIYRTKEDAQTAIQPIIERINKITAELPQFKV